MYAQCGVHGRDCRLTRTLNGRGRLPQGRPLGLLTLFLQKSEDPECGSAEAHKRHFRDPQPWADRKAARAAFKAQDFLELERDRFDGEDSEPE